ncbi:MAG: hypothetical protein IPP67_09015 [Rhodospirillaceae bacterium]|nr:hypothetical protein [Rhodospirillaceae bacterium]
MKFHIEVECPPEEIRRLVGLPDVSAMQQELLKEIQEKLLSAISESSPEKLLKSWMGGMSENWQEWQKKFADFSSSFQKKDSKK